jgi:hypothetical protein
VVGAYSSHETNALGGFRTNRASSVEPVECTDRFVMRLVNLVQRIGERCGDSVDLFPKLITVNVN